MIQMGHVKEIMEVKECLQQMVEKGWVAAWELPYETLLTRLSAAMFFLSLNEGIAPDTVWKELNKHPAFVYKKNEHQEISGLEWQVEYNKELAL